MILLMLGLLDRSKRPQIDIGQVTKFVDFTTVADDWQYGKVDYDDHFETREGYCVSELIFVLVHMSFTIQMSS